MKLGAIIPGGWKRHRGREVRGRCFFSPLPNWAEPNGQIWPNLTQKQAATQIQFRPYYYDDRGKADIVICISVQRAEQYGIRFGQVRGNTCVDCPNRVTTDCFEWIADNKTHAIIEAFESCRTKAAETDAAGGNAWPTAIAPETWD